MMKTIKEFEAEGKFIVYQVDIKEEFPTITAFPIIAKEGMNFFVASRLAPLRQTTRTRFYHTFAEAKQCAMNVNKERIEECKKKMEEHMEYMNKIRAMMPGTVEIFDI